MKELCIEQKYNRVPQLRLGLEDDIVIDNFAGGGGASTGIEQALGRPVDIAINHDPAAIAMHSINHPYTKHYCESVWKVDPIKACNGRTVKLAWFSPDCTHFTKARGGKPKSKKIRGLAWLAVRWIKRLKPTNQHPELIVMENVEEFQTWGPLLPSGHPCPVRAGTTFNQFIDILKDYGYSVDWRELRARDYGVPTIRKRLFIIARRDEQSIMWPYYTHGAGLAPYKTTADCIDWSKPTKSIFTRARPLADNTLRRIAAGIERFVFDDAKAFIVPIQNYGGKSPIVHSIDEPIRTITAQPKGGAFALVTSLLEKCSDKSINIVTSNGIRASKPSGKNNGRNSDQVKAFLIKYYGTSKAISINTPLHTITTKDRFGLVTIKGDDYKIADIGLRMLTPRELFCANGFPADYIIDRNPDGTKTTISDQVARCGNSVPPAFARAIVNANINSNSIVNVA